MQMNVANSLKFQINKEDLEYVTRSTYLRSVMSNDGSTDKDIKCRKGTAVVFRALKPIWASSHITLYTKYIQL